MSTIRNIVSRFRRLLLKRAAMVGKSWIRQKPDRTLYVDGTQLDRDELAAMTSWQEMVDMGISRETISKIVREYSGHPSFVANWLEQNSKPYEEEKAEEEEEKIEEPLSDDLGSLAKQLKAAFEEAEDDIIYKSPKRYFGRGQSSVFKFNWNNDVWAMIVKVKDETRSGHNPKTARDAEVHVFFPKWKMWDQVPLTTYGWIRGYPCPVDWDEAAKKVKDLIETGPIPF